MRSYRTNLGDMELSLEDKADLKRAGLFIIWYQSRDLGASSTPCHVRSSPPAVAAQLHRQHPSLLLLLQPSSAAAPSATASCSSTHYSPLPSLLTLLSTAIFQPLPLLPHRCRCCSQASGPSANLGHATPSRAINARFPLLPYPMPPSLLLSFPSSVHRGRTQCPTAPCSLFLSYKEDRLFPPACSAKDCSKGKGFLQSFLKVLLKRQQPILLE
ncbi:hypothetical protein BHE74_00037995 [Ensete ventricosum]|nr:hypothetical protein BHE74_00037995 [Ensete ventricosum]